MEARKIDNLFKGKLKTQISDPKEESWGALEFMLDSNNRKKKTLWIWKVAAVVILFITSVLIFSPLNRSETSQLSTNMMESLKEEAVVNNTSLIVKEVEVLEEEEHVRSIENNELALVDNKPSINQQVVVERFDEKELEVTFPDDIVIEEEQAIAVTNNQIENPKKRMPVRITYKRTRKASQVTLAAVAADTAQNGIRNLMEKTRQINPGELWADMRDAKDEFFNSPLDLKKRKVKNSNK